jgi:hypothetical protein
MLDGTVMYSACNAVYRKECLKDCRFDEGTKYEDVPFTVKLLHSIDSILYIDIPLYGYRQRGGSITKTMTPDNLEHLIRAYVLQLQYIKGFFPGLQTSARAAMWAAVLNHYIAYTSGKREDRKQYEDMIRDFSRKHRLTVRELTHPGIPLRRRVAIGLAEISFKAAAIVKKRLMR